MFVQSAAVNRRFAFGAGCVIMAAKKTKGRPGVPGRKHMSNFNDLYDHVAADRSRAMQLLGIQDIRRKAVAELLILVGRGLQGVDETLLLFQESNSLGLSAF